MMEPSGRLLRACRKRPRDRAAKRDNEFSPPDADCHVTLPWGVMQCNYEMIPRFTRARSRVFRAAIVPWNFAD